MSGIHKRLITEIDKLQKLSGSFILDSASPDAVIGRILPQSNIFNQAGFQIELKLVEGYPFIRPVVRFITRIYHPNIHPSGHIKFHKFLFSEVYKPTTSLAEIVNEIINVIDDPNPNTDHPMNFGI